MYFKYIFLAKYFFMKPLAAVSFSIRSPGSNRDEQTNIFAFFKSALTITSEMEIDFN